jgi:hypothetical protein
LAELTGQPFDLARGPLLRATLIPVVRDDAVLLLVMHHIVTDQWSLDIMTRELAEAYSASPAGMRAVSAPSYADYAAWHRHWFTAQRLQRELKLTGRGRSSLRFGGRRFGFRSRRSMSRHSAT